MQVIMKTPLIAGNSLRRTISSQAYNFIRRFNDYSEKKYIQVNGNGEQLFLELKI
jgi:hypothetical protein